MKGGNMIELKKRDIESLALARFSWRTRYKFAGFILGVMVVVVVIALITPDSLPLWQKIARFAPVFAGLIYVAIRYGQAQNKAVKEFVEQCERDPELYYTISRE